MSTFLELCNDLHERIGESGSGLTTVVGQSGVNLKIVNLIKNAWLDIQEIHPEWRFLRKVASPTIADTEDKLDVATWVTANLSSEVDYYHTDTFSIYHTSTGVSDESKMIYIPWERWKEEFGISYNDGTKDRPLHFTIDPDDEDIKVGPIANDGYTIHFELQVTPITLAADSDTPDIVSGLHRIIVWRALLDYAGDEESNFDLNRAEKQFKKYLARMELRYLPPITLPEPLA